MKLTAKVSKKLSIRGRYSWIKGFNGSIKFSLDPNSTPFPKFCITFEIKTNGLLAFSGISKLQNVNILLILLNINTNSNQQHQIPQEIL